MHTTDWIAPVFYAVYTTGAVLFMHIPIWKVLFAMGLTEVILRVTASSYIQHSDARKLLIHPIHHAFSGQLAAYQKTGSSVFLTSARRMLYLHYGRWFIFSVLLHLSLFPHSPIIPYVYLYNLDGFTQRYGDPDAYPLAAVFYTILYVPYIIIALILDILIAAVNSAILGIIPCLILRFHVSRIQKEHLSPPQPQAEAK